VQLFLRESIKNIEETLTDLTSIVAMLGKGSMSIDRAGCIVRRRGLHDLDRCRGD
jgi:hypothetical protein